MKKLFGFYPSTPCIPYGARKALNSIINADMRLVEFGSGQSTLWYAKRCREIVSLETTDIQDVNTIDLHIWKITITL